MHCIEFQQKTIQARLLKHHEETSLYSYYMFDLNECIHIFSQFQIAILANTVVNHNTDTKGSTRLSKKCRNYETKLSCRSPHTAKIPEELTKIEDLYESAVS